MKTNILIPSLLLTVSCISAQSLKEKEVPAPVRDAFERSHDGTKPDKWEKENGNYEAEYKSNGKEYSVLMDAQGNLLETEEEIRVSELPGAVQIQWE